MKYSYTIANDRYLGISSFDQLINHIKSVYKNLIFSFLRLIHLPRCHMIC